MTVLFGGKVWALSLAKTGSEQNRWRLRSRAGVWRQLLAIAVLTSIFLGVVLVCFAPLIGQRSNARKSNLTDLLQMGRVPHNLPGIPQAGAGGMTFEPPALEGQKALEKNARTLFAALGPPARPFRFAGSLPERMNARACLAAAMVYEAGDDPVGQLAVGQVILNRARHPAFPSSVCGVVTQGSDRSTGCQFTFTCDGSLGRNISLPVRTRALIHADLMLDGLVFAGVGLATHYHTTGVYPWWSPKLDKMARVGTHLFFRWKGVWGSSRVFGAERRASEPTAALFAQFSSVTPKGDALADLADTPGGYLAGQHEIAPSIALSRVPGGTLAASSTSLARASAIPESRRLSRQDPRELERQSSSPIAPALQGVRLLRMFPDKGIFYLQLLEGSSLASRKRAAEQLCGGRSICQVYGWWKADAVPDAEQLDATSRATIAFRFARNLDSNARSRSPSAMVM